MKNKDKQSYCESEDSTENLSVNVVDAFRKLQKNHPEFTEQELKDEINTLLGTGTDTAGTTLSSCLLALAQFQEIQERVYQEILSVIGPDDCDVTADDLQRMPYLDQVLKETLRRFTIVPYLTRKASEDIKLSTCIIPAGSNIVVSLLGTLMDPHQFPDPLTFDPDRFSPDNTSEGENTTFIPFSCGPRNCIGKQYSIYLLKTVLVHLLRSFRVKTEMDINKLRRRLMMVLVSDTGYNISLDPRS